MLVPTSLSRSRPAGCPAQVGPSTSPVTSPVLCLVDYGVSDEHPVGSTNIVAVHLGGIDLVRYQGVGLHRGNRQLHHVREDQSDDFLITIPIDARINFSQQGYSNGSEPGTFVVLSTAAPFYGCISSMKVGGAFSALHMRISGALLRGRVPHIDSYCDRPLSLSSASGNIIRGFFELTLAEGHSLSGTAAHAITLMLADAVAILISDTPQAISRTRSTADSHTSIYRRALGYIEENLSKPGLNAELIGQHCHVSVRYLQFAFARMSKTVVSVVRDRRLERCREDLENPQLSHKSVTQVAMSWGFNDLAYFSRAFRRRFGCAPSALRSRCRDSVMALPVPA